MNKHTFLGITGILFCCALMIGGWFFTLAMLNQSERALLSQSGTIKLTVQAPDIPAEPGDNPMSYQPANLAETIHILSVWETQDNVKPHEPSVGQLTMEQAVSIGKVWLQTLSKQALIPTLANNSRVEAYLCANVPDPSALLAEVPPALGSIRQESELIPYFSYWTVQFQHKELHATLIINAVTAEVWSAELRFSASGMKVNPEIEKTLTSFVEQLSLPGGETLIIDGQNAVHSFEDGTLLAVAEIQEEADTQVINLSLTTR